MGSRKASGRTAARPAPHARGANKPGTKKRGRPSNAEREARRVRETGNAAAGEVRAATEIELLRAIYGHLLSQSNETRQQQIRLEAQVHAQQQTIGVLQRQLEIAQNAQELLLSRVLNAPAPTPGPAFGATGPVLSRTPRVAVDFAAPPPDTFTAGQVFNGPSLPMPKGANDRPAPPSTQDLADTYLGAAGVDLFGDIGDDEAARHGISNDDVTGTVQRGARRPVS